MRIEVEGETVVKTVEKAVENLLSYVNCYEIDGTEENSFSIKCRRIEVCIKRLLRKLLQMLLKEGKKTENFSLIISPQNGRWVFEVKVVSKKCNLKSTKINRIKDVELEERTYGWKLKISTV